MGNLVDKKTGERTYIDDADMPDAMASGKYAAPDAVAVQRFGQDTYVTPDVQKTEGVLAPQVGAAQVELSRGQRAREIENTGLLATGKAALGGFVDSGTFGAWSPFEDAQEFHGIASTVGGLGAAIAPAFFGDEAGILSAFRDPLEAERGASALSSKFLLGGEIGGEAGSAAKSAERGLARASETIAGGNDAAAVSDDLAGKTLRDLRGERAKEIERLATEGKAATTDELARIESERAPQRAQLASDLGAHREALGDEKIWLATMQDDAKEIGNVSEIGAQSRKADNAIRDLLNNPDALAERPSRMIEPLQRQRTALLRLQEEEPELRKLFATDASGDRLASLDAIPGALDRNRSLEVRARALATAPKSERLDQIAQLLKEPKSARLDSIQGAEDVLRAPKPPEAPRSLAEDMLTGTVMHSIGAHVPFVGHALGAKAGRFVSDLVFGRLGKATGEIAARTKSAVSAFTGAVARSKITPVLASRVLANVRYAPAGSVPEPIPVKGESKLATAFKQRAAELKTQTQYGPDGKPVMRQDARLAMADQLAALRAMDSIGADQIEAIAAARVEFLSSKLPRKPSINGIPVGPDHWQPSDMEMRQFARYAAAVEDPGGVEERAVHGAVTPEDAEAYHAVYPARAQHFLDQILGNLPGLRTSLPYGRRLALSIFAGAPVDPALDPRILKVLQGQFDEPNSKGGTQQPQANPQFGSVSKSVEKPTPAQSRSG